MAEYIRPYAQATHVYIPITKRGVVDFGVGADWTPAAGDVKVSIDGAAVANIGTLPTAIASGNTAFWDFSLSAAELTGKKIVVMVSDAATKAVEDDGFSIITTSNMENAEIKDGILRVGLAQAGGSTSTVKLDSSASASDDYYRGCLISVKIAAATAVSKMAWGVCTGYNGTTKVATIQGTWTNAGSPAASDEFTIFMSALGQTGADIADAIAARNYQGGSDSAPTNADIMAAGLLKFDMSPNGATISVYHNDGTTVAFTRTVTRAVLDAMLKMV